MPAIQYIFGTVAPVVDGSVFVFVGGTAVNKTLLQADICSITSFDAHRTRVDNPHQVSYSQVGAAPLAHSHAIISGTGSTVECNAVGAVVITPGAGGFEVQDDDGYATFATLGVVVSGDLYVGGSVNGDLSAATATTLAAATSNTSLATTAFVHAVAAAILNSPPSTLDTLKELADALGNDPNFAATITALIGAKLAKASNLSDLTNAATARTNLGCAATSHTHGAADVNSGTLAVARGGTGTGTQFTAGSIPFAGASGVYAQDNANLFWDDTNDRLGIGTTSPQQAMHLYKVGSSRIQVESQTSTAEVVMVCTNTPSAWVFYVHPAARWRVEEINVGTRIEIYSGLAGQIVFTGPIVGTSTIQSATYTVAGLPAAGTAGRTAFATNGRKNGEGGGAGTGVLVFDDGTAWRACDTGATVAA